MAVSTIEPIIWQDDHLLLLDQRALPGEERYLRIDSAAGVARAIRGMVVRGAPAIGIAAAYGVVLAAREAVRRDGSPDLERALQCLADARPTAVNLHWALARMRRCLRTLAQGDTEGVLEEARRIHQEDVAQNRRMGALGAALIERPSRLLTHCNTGSLATGGYGTALGVVRAAHAGGRVIEVFADETRPWLQGARLTAWELAREAIPARLVADGAAAFLMAQGRVDWVIVGADRIAANGDVANKIGTYALAVAAQHHGLPFMVVAPSGTVDMDTATGADIPIEERAATELTQVMGHAVAPAGFAAFNPVFDVTPARLVTALVTERGVLAHPDEAAMRRLFGVGAEGR